MKIAVAVTDGHVGDPGECDQVYIYEADGNGVKMIEKFENPGKKAIAAPGVVMLRNAIERGANAVVLSEIGRPGTNYLRGRAKVYLADGLPAEEAVKEVMAGSIPETLEPTHEGHSGTEHEGMHEHHRYNR
ncbi:MAG: NifB/NifX family molybdenum-iron cluster-binding protein [Thermoplasmata archaeon]